MNESKLKVNSARAWGLAARPKTLSAALVPVAVASAIAYSDGVFAWRPALICVLFAEVMQVAANFINDLIDFLKDTDRSDRLGPGRACAQGWITPRAMRVGIGIAVTIACIVGLLLLPYGGLPLIYIGVACIVFAFLYTTMLSYVGLGDVLVWVFFGLVPVCATYYVQTGMVPTHVWWAAAGCGLCIDSLLILNNYRDRHTDAAVGKRTIIVVLGERFGSLLYLVSGIAAAVCASVALLLDDAAMWIVILPMLYLIPHVRAWRTMISIYRGRDLNKVLGMTSVCILIYGVVVALAFIIA